MLITSKSKKRQWAEEIADLWDVDATKWSDSDLYLWMSQQGYVWRDNDWHTLSRRHQTARKLAAWNGNAQAWKDE